MNELSSFSIKKLPDFLGQLPVGLSLFQVSVLAMLAVAGNLLVRKFADVAFAIWATRSLSRTCEKCYGNGFSSWSWWV